MPPPDTTALNIVDLDIEDANALRRYLARRSEARSGEVLSCRKLAGGVSNRTVRVEWTDGRAWVLKQALAKLRVNVDWFCNPERIRVEAQALRWLNCNAPPGTTPGFIFEDADHHLLAMEAIAEDHENWKSVLLAGRIVPQHFRQFGSLLGVIHRKSAENGAEVRRAFAESGYFESLRLEPYYRYTAQKVPAAESFLNVLTQETLRRKLSLVHGDFSPKNTLLYRDQLILLDYEVMHFGDPAFDVGFALAHFLSKAHHLRRQRALLAENAALFWSSYCEEVASLPWGDLAPWAVRHTLGCLLARVEGKSTLEYLTPQEISRQREAVLFLMSAPPTNMSDLIAGFIREIEAHAEN